MLLEKALPFLNILTGKALSFRTQDFFLQLALLVGIGLVVGVAAGSYTAFYASAFRPVAVLKGTPHQGSRRSAFRAALVVAQSVIAIVLLISTFVVYRQLAFVSNQRLGFDNTDSHHVVVSNSLFGHPPQRVRESPT